MKKIISLALATALAFSLSAVAFAAGSVTDYVEDLTTEVESIVVTDASGNVVDVTVSTVAVEDSSLLTKLSAATSAEEAVEIFTASVLHVINLTEKNTVTVVGSIDIAIEATAGEAVTVSIPMDVTLASGEALFAYHELADGSSELIVCSVSNGVVSFSVTSGSPFTFFKVATTTTSSSSSSSSSDTTTTETVTSPVTGETNAAALVACMMLFAGVAVCTFVRKEQN